MFRMRLAALSAVMCFIAHGQGELPGTTTLVLPVRVMSTALKAMNGLQASDFVLTINRHPQEISGFSHARLPLSMGILLDVSGSMGFLMDGVGIGHTGVEHLLGESLPEDEFFIVSVGNRAILHRHFTSDTSHLLDDLPAQAKGKTSLLDGLSMALEEMRNARHANRSILVVSDGGENHSAHKVEQLTRALSSLPVPIFLLVPGRGTPPTPVLTTNPDEDREPMFQLVTKSGGHVIGIADSRAMRGVMHELANAIRYPYLLQFVTSEEQSKKPLDVRVEIQGMRKQPYLYYRGAYRPRPSTH